MKKHLVRLLLGTAVCCLGLAAEVRAGSLFGKVIAVNDGDEITVFSLNRPARIKLIGIDAPEKEQPFGAVARQHLSDLVLDKDVVVEYTAISHDYSIIGAVLLSGVDIGAQMIRDGAAWYDPNGNHLTDPQRAVYSQSEQAARREKRGLWQAENPMAPWDFVKQQAGLRLATKKQSAEADANPMAVPPRPAASLTNESLLKMGGPAASPQAGADYSETSSLGDPGLKHEWKHFHPAGSDFTAFVPSGGKQMTTQLPLGNGEAQVNYYIAYDAESVYALTWANGPSVGESDTSVIKLTMSGFLQGLHEAWGRKGAQLYCESSSEKDVSTGGYTGREFDLAGCSIPGIARFYTKVVNGERQLFGGVAFSPRGEPNVAKFIQSFTIKGTMKDKTKSSAKVSSPAVR